jgi:ABC-2 type transport system permease protein
MHKTWLIARREYLAYVRTVGFWLSLLTVPLIAAGAIVFPLMLNQSAPAQQVAILDLSGQHLDNRLEAMVRSHKDGFRRSDRLRIVPLPPGLSPNMTLAVAEAKLPGMVAAKDAPSILVAYSDASGLHFHIWSQSGHKGDAANVLQNDLNDLEAERLAEASGVDPQLAQKLRAAKADIVNLTPSNAVRGGRMSEKAERNAPRVLGAIVGYLAWTTIFSSSMLLLGSVIEEKSSKVLEVLLASTSTTSLLVGKVLGGAMVLLTVAAIWITTAVILGGYGLSMLKPDMLQAVSGVAQGLFSPVHIALLLLYFITGYLMFGVLFAAIGAFCETQKDAQAVMGPIMIVLMVPLLTLQAAMMSGDIPLVRYLSWVPLFSPFLMPVRLSQPLPWYEIAGTLAGMGLLAMLMIRMGGKAFRHGALSGVRLSWGALLGFGRKDA